MAMEKPRVKLPSKANKGEIIEIKTLISHPMETGQRKDAQGKTIPRQIINKMAVTYNGKELFTANLAPAISANPYISFFARADESGTIEFTWFEDGGEKLTHQEKIEVS
jgi:sulfur-oxidizing protein SoxZ